MVRTEGARPFPVYRSFSSQIGFNMWFHFQLLLAFGLDSLSSLFLLRHLLNTLLQHNYHNPIGENFITWSYCHYKLPLYRSANVFLITNNYIVFLYFWFPVANVNYHSYCAIQMFYQCQRRKQIFASIVRQYLLWTRPLSSPSSS